MVYDPIIHHRRSIRLKGYDYSQAGAYFITICVDKKLPLLSQIRDHLIFPTEAGQMIQTIWDELPQHYPSVATDAFVLMPNHIHGIIWLNKQQARERSDGKVLMLGDTIHRFKSFSTAKYRHGVKFLGWQPFQQRFWQRNYYEKIIWNELILEKIREYILNNPIAWEAEKDHLQQYHQKIDL